MQQHKIRYKFHRDFPKSLQIPFLIALLQAIKMWEESGNVVFLMTTDDEPDFWITWELIGNEYGDISKQLYSPAITYRTQNEQDINDTSLIVNCCHNWKTKWYHFFRDKFDPIVVAHNLGHIMGLCIKKHVKNPDSVMFENPIVPPCEKDFQIMRLALSKRNRKQ